MAEIRRSFPALAAGHVHPLWIDSASGSEDDGVFAFACAAKGEETVLVVANAGTSLRTAGLDEHPMRLVAADGSALVAPGQQIKPIWPEGTEDSRVPQGGLLPIKPVWQDNVPCAILPALPESVTLHLPEGHQWQIAFGNSEPARRPALTAGKLRIPPVSAAILAAD